MTKVLVQANDHAKMKCFDRCQYVLVWQLERSGAERAESARKVCPDDEHPHVFAGIKTVGGVKPKLPRRRGRLV